jgi:glycosyltransferase involved in cell wall biosynthesis
LKICFILDHDLKDYRKPFFQRLAQKKYNILIIHPGQELLGFSSSVNQISIQSKKKFGFEIRKLVKLKGIDVVIHMQNIRLLSLWKLTLSPFRSYKIIHWGIGTSSSKGLKSETKKVRFLRNFVSYFADAQILYSDFALKKYPIKVQEKSFIANNTVESLYSEDFSAYEKDSFLFIGSLNKRKGLDILIEAFDSYIKSGKRKIKKLYIIGDGSERDNLLFKVKELGLLPFVTFSGNIQEEKLKLPFYKKALVSISPKQAGLSVLECFSYGVPFIAFEDAISGGEHLNIQNGVNGFLVKDWNELVERMIQLDNQIELAQSLGYNAFNHYTERRSMTAMVETFCQAIDFVSKNS